MEADEISFAKCQPRCLRVKLILVCQAQQETRTVLGLDIIECQA